MTKRISAFFDLGFRTSDESPPASRAEMVTPPDHDETPHTQVPSAPSVPVSWASRPIHWVALVFVAICIGALIGMPRITSYPSPTAVNPPDATSSLVLVIA